MATCRTKSEVGPKIYPVAGRGAGTGRRLAPFIVTRRPLDDDEHHSSYSDTVWAPRRRLAEVVFSV